MITLDFYKNIFKRCLSGMLFKNTVPAELRNRSIFNAVLSFRNLLRMDSTLRLLLIAALMKESGLRNKRIFPDSKILLIEALPEKEKYLAKIKMEYSNVDYEMALLGARPAENIKFYKNEYRIVCFLKNRVMSLAR